MKNMLKKIHKTSERGQAIILIAFSIVGLVAIVGLMIDGGIMLIEYARLKRGIDAASIAAASQFRKDFAGEDLVKAGEEFLKFNQADADITIFTCSCPPNEPNCVADGWHLDAQLCPPFVGPTSRKLVKIAASRRVDFGFIKVVGIDSTTISAVAIGEAASIDMVLVLDTSSSMSYETTGTDAEDKADPGTGNPGDDPAVCNAHMGDGPHEDETDLLRRCEPMGKVIDAAVSFVDELFFPYDRVALVATSGQPGVSNIADREPVTVLDFNDNYTDDGDPATDNLTTDIQTAIRGLKVFQPGACPNPLPEKFVSGYPTLCLQYNNEQDPTKAPYYRTQLCLPRYLGYDNASGVYIKGDTTTCGPSNIGGGLYEAGYQFAFARQDSFWVTIALFGGPANASNPPSYPNGLCPGSENNPTWTLAGGSGFCRDEDTMPASYLLNRPTSTWFNGAKDSTPMEEYTDSYDWSTYNWKNASRHPFTVDTTDPDNHIVVYPANYDADDYARDGADYITSNSIGQGATLFSICMGAFCKSYPNANDPASGELLGRYMALHAGDEYDLLGNVSKSANHGQYYYAENSDELLGPTGVFARIAENIFTRISQ